MNTNRFRKIIPIISIFIILSLLLIQARPVLAESDSPADGPAPVVNTAGVSPGGSEPIIAEADPVLPPAAIIQPAGSGLVVDPATLLKPTQSQQYAITIHYADPYFKILGITYNFTTADCQPNVAGLQGCDNPIQAAINYLSSRNLTPDGGNIVVEAGNYNVGGAINPSANINFNGSAWVTKPLAIIFSGAGSSPITGSNITGVITIQNMKNFTVRGFNVIGNIYFNNNIGTAAVADVTIKNSAFLVDGLNISNHTGSISLDRVTASNNGGNGANIDTAASANSVSVINSSFGNNFGTGLIIKTKAAISINGVNAAGNLLGNGIYLDNTTGTGTISILNSNAYWNGFRGIEAYSKGAITAANLNAANHISGEGAILDNSTAAIAQPISLTIGNFTKNVDGGLYVYSKGFVTLNSIVATVSTGVGSIGIDVDNSGGTAGVSLLHDKGPNLVSNINGNGVIIYTRGPVLVNGLASMNNNGVGVGITIGAGNQSTRVWGGFFSGNNNYGLGVLSTGPITISETNTLNNARGGYLHNDASTIASAVIIDRSNFNGNGDDGVDLVTKGLVNITSLIAMNNAGDGASIDATPGIGTVTFSGSNAFNGNMNNGLQLTAQGLITLANLSMMGNGSDGGAVTNVAGTAGAGIIFSNVHASGNGGMGLNAASEGSLVIDKTTALLNSDEAAYFDNSAVVTAKPVTITNSNFSGNDGAGLVVISKGNIVMSTSIALANTGLGGSGAILVNDVAGSTGTITVTGEAGKATFSNNSEAGLTAVSRGAITIITVIASQNGDTGAVLVGSTALAKVTVSSGSFNYNTGGVGLVVSTLGSIAATTINAIGNNDDGILLINSGAAINTQTVSLSNVDAEMNNGLGITIESSGAISISYSYSVGNNDVGTYLDNDGAGVTGGITLTGINQSNSNNGNGMEITSNGAVAVTNLVSRSNNGDGFVVDTHTAAGNVTLNNLRLTNNNGYGLYASGVMGNALLTRIYAAQNSSMGAYLNVTPAGKTLTVQTSNFLNNNDDGLNLTANGDITLNNVWSNYNTGATAYGAYITANGAGKVSILNTLGGNHFDGNTMSGFDIWSSGVVVINQTTASGNGIAGDLPGIWVGTPGQAVTISCGYFNGNGKNGIEAAIGAANLTLRGVRADGNDLSGGAVDPDVIYSGTLTLAALVCGNW